MLRRWLHSLVMVPLAGAAVLSTAREDARPGTLLPPHMHHRRVGRPPRDTSTGELNASTAAVALDVYVLQAHESSMEAEYAAYLLDYLRIRRQPSAELADSVDHFTADDAPTEGGRARTSSWSNPTARARVRLVNAGAFFDALQGGFEQLRAGTVVIVSHSGLEGGVSPASHGGQQQQQQQQQQRRERALHEPPHITRQSRVHALLNVSVPLVVVLTHSPTCALEWPNTTHHLLYRTSSWSAKWHAEWLESRESDQRSNGRDGWLRALPFGMTYGRDVPTIHELRGVRAGSARGVSERPLLFNYRGITDAWRDEGRGDADGMRLVATFTEAKQRIDEAAESWAETARDLWESESSVWNATTSSSSQADDAKATDADDSGNRSSTSAKASAAAAAASAPSAPPPMYYVFESPTDPPTNPGPKRGGRRSYVRLLQESVFTLCPMGSRWDSTRAWDALHAGSIPVVVAPQSVSSGGCDRPAAHFLHTTPGVVMVRDWSQLPDVLEKAATDPERVANRQRVMLAGLRTRRRSDRRLLLQTVQDMQASVDDPSRWRPRTACTEEASAEPMGKGGLSPVREPKLGRSHPLSPHEVPPPAARSSTSADAILPALPLDVEMQARPDRRIFTCSPLQKPSKTGWQ